ncbi:MAG: hypothetical protein HY841_11465 [Bacteroidetes bacterium]|nr:hypothetical protein [Bacteroidota bacterium]
MTRIIADIKDKQDADTIVRVIKKFKGKVKTMTDEQWEDYILGLLAEEGEADKETVSRAEVAKWFRKHEIDF